MAKRAGCSGGSFLVVCGNLDYLAHSAVAEGCSQNADVLKYGRKLGSGYVWEMYIKH